MYYLKRLEYMVNLKRYMVENLNDNEKKGMLEIGIKRVRIR